MKKREKSKKSKMVTTKKQAYHLFLKIRGDINRHQKLQKKLTNLLAELNYNRGFYSEEKYIPINKKDYQELEKIEEKILDKIKLDIKGIEI